jgi:pimeloyl-ACP methyl ester carboxylesterase
MDAHIKHEQNFKYIEEGEGDVLLLLHGLFGALSNWKDVLEHFSRNYKVVIPLMPIFEMNILTLSVDSLAKFIHSFVVYKKYQKVNLLGNSLGGHVALVYLKEHPEMVNSLILTGSSGLYENAFGESYPKKNDKQYLKERIGLTFYDPSNATDELVDEVHSTLQDKSKVLSILKIAKSAIRHNMRKDIPKMNVPVCLIWGLDDRITPPEVGKEFNELLPDSQLHLLEKCGHAPMMEQPEAFNAIVGEFYNKLFSQK